MASRKWEGNDWQSLASSGNPEGNQSLGRAAGGGRTPASCKADFNMSADLQSRLEGGSPTPSTPANSEVDTLIPIA